MLLYPSTCVAAPVGHGKGVKLPPKPNTASGRLFLRRGPPSRCLLDHLVPGQREHLVREEPGRASIPRLPPAKVKLRVRTAAGAPPPDSGHTNLLLADALSSLLPAHIILYLRRCLESARRGTHRGHVYPFITAFTSSKTVRWSTWAETTVHANPQPCPVTTFSTCSSKSHPPPRQSHPPSPSHTISCRPHRRQYPSVHQSTAAQCPPCPASASPSAPS